MPESHPQFTAQAERGFPFENRSSETTDNVQWRHFYLRLAQLATLLSIELVIISVWLDAGDLKASQGLISWVHRFGPWLVRIIVASAFFSIFFAGSRPQLRYLPKSALTVRYPWRFLAGHSVALGLFAGLSSWLFKTHVDGNPGNIVALGWLATGLLAVALAAVAFVPATVWLGFARRNLDVCAFAFCAGCIAYLLGNASRALWIPLSRATFVTVQIFLRPLLPGLISNPATLIIGTQRFLVEIAPECSGYEGIGLVLAFCSAWLWFLRREWRFPQALLLLPAGAALIWVSNAARIALLILIGHAGARRLALEGFHSQAGWIACTAITLGLCFTARRVGWFNRLTPSGSDDWHSLLSTSATPFLLPMLAMLAAALVSRGVAGGFEYLDPLRFFAGAAVLWFFRRRYAKLDWHAGWAGFALGGLVFLVWMAFNSRDATNSITTFPDAMAHSWWGIQFSWIACRILGTVFIAPAAEELAYREYLLLRLHPRDTAQVRWSNLPWLALIVSSFAYGVLQGGQWVAGTIVGILFGLALLRRCRIGDAFAAHSAANALSLLWVLLGHSGQILS